MECGYFPGSSALDPHFSESNDQRRTRLKGDFWIPRIDPCEVVQQPSDNNHRVAKVTYHDVAPVKRGNPRLSRPQQRRQMARNTL